MADIEIPKGDKGFDLDFTVTDSSGSAYNLSGYTVKLKVWTLGISGKLLLTGSCNITDAVSGTCTYPVVVTDFDLIGKYRAEIELTKTDTIESTESFGLEVMGSG